MIDTDALEDAARIVEAAARRLNTSAATCAECGHIQYEAWTEKQIKDELDAIVRKLRRFAGRDSK